MVLGITTSAGQSGGVIKVAAERVFMGYLESVQDSKGLMVSAERIFSIIKFNKL